MSTARRNCAARGAACEKMRTRTSGKPAVTMAISGGSGGSAALGGGAGGVLEARMPLGGKVKQVQIVPMSMQSSQAWSKLILLHT